MDAIAFDEIVGGDGAAVTDGERAVLYRVFNGAPEARGGALAIGRSHQELVAVYLIILTRPRRRNRARFGGIMESILDVTPEGVWSGRGRADDISARLNGKRGL